MTDFHSHFLPGIDDGSDSVETSLAMLKLWQEQKIDRLCATPHFYADRNTPSRFLRRRAAAHEALSSAMYQSDIDIPILLGAEVRFFDGISVAEELPALCLQGTNLLLLEMPFTKWTDRMIAEVADIRCRGLRPVAAHIERYMNLNPRKTLQRFMDLDIFIQCNAEFFLSRRTSRKALRMLKEERIHFLGSDAHNMSSRKPNLRPALDLIEKKLGTYAVQRLTEFEEFMDAGTEAFI